MAIMTIAAQKKSMLITYGDPPHNCQCTPGSSCDYCGSSRRGRRQGRTHVSVFASDRDLQVAQEFVNSPQLGGADDSGGSRRGGSSDGYSSAIAIPADLTRLHRGTRFPCSMYYGQRQAALLIDAGRKFNSVEKSHADESYPIPIFSYPDTHRCKTFPCPYCGNGY